ncbi:MAG: 23S rRNA (pseudouridine1915-N3)-methyltransferase [Patiriisocius sp.]|jgi:23S rRNA (pseudouridine1915-N3)-methyltransferase
MKIKMIYVGKSKKEYLKGSLQDFYVRIRKYISLEEIIIPDVSGKGGDTGKRMIIEGNSILDKIKDNELVVLLDEGGKRMTSRAFADYINEKMVYSSSNIVFVVGGAFGFSEEVKLRSNDAIRLSDMTFSHQLIRLIMAEQLYRAMSIINGHPYHND